jgi:hypothetical protein
MKPNQYTGRAVQMVLTAATLTSPLITSRPLPATSFHALYVQKHIIENFEYQSRGVQEIKGFETINRKRNRRKLPVIGTKM